MPILQTTPCIYKTTAALSHAIKTWIVVVTLASEAAEKGYYSATFQLLQRTRSASWLTQLEQYSVYSTVILRPPSIDGVRGTQPVFWHHQEAAAAAAAVADEDLHSDECSDRSIWLSSAIYREDINTCVRTVRRWRRQGMQFSSCRATPSHGLLTLLIGDNGQLCSSSVECDMHLPSTACHEKPCVAPTRHKLNYHQHSPAVSVKVKARSESALGLHQQKMWLRAVPGTFLWSTHNPSIKLLANTALLQRNAGNSKKLRGHTADWRVAEKAK